MAFQEILPALKVGHHLAATLLRHVPEFIEALAHVISLLRGHVLDPPDGITNHPQLLRGGVKQTSQHIQAIETARLARGPGTLEPVALVTLGLPALVRRTLFAIAVLL